MSVQGRGAIRRLLADHDLRPQKRFGQNFLADPNIVDRIVRFSGVAADSKVVEVGAGTGTLTATLAATGATVVAYEIDRSLESLLQETLGSLANVEVRFTDIQKVDLNIELEGEGWILVANLPYNVGTPILLDALRGVPGIGAFIVMVQREVADRLVAEPGSKVYGLPSVVARLWGEPSFGFEVSPSVFIPPPDVDSAVVRIDRIVASPFAVRAAELAASAFGQRRKMIRKSLGGAVVDVQTLLEAAGVDGTRRAETLSAADYVHLAETEVAQ
ncbi:SSU rRNA (adenine(1518)-N(6)/adenine(1519)-N(6))-dimethyltransferase [hydrothermal vent metagenome]|uniref:SSU rRNA (Adenine(1518)-N(6)/adenine(1519)-N(6))-dimethyltransferase n=1 Tax=hydrothermal vent metagenome TaxID=652676 RepID=A0A3B0TJI5_9ZZZZ